MSQLLAIYLNVVIDVNNLIGHQEIEKVPKKIKIKAKIPYFLLEICEWPYKLQQTAPSPLGRGCE